MAGLLESVREHCAAIAEPARLVRFREDVLPAVEGRSGLDPAVHLLDAPDEDRARYVLVLDAVNFGSGWFSTLRAPPGEDLTTAMSRALTRHARRRGGPWTGEELRALDAATVAAVLGQSPQHELMGLYARALNQLGAWLGARSALQAVAAARGSAERFAESLAEGMPFFDDRGFYKRAQIAANDLVLAGVADFGDVDDLTIFADNLLPHVLRMDGVLDYEAGLAARIDDGQVLRAGSRPEAELRGCAVHACEHIAAQLGMPPRVLDNRLWNRGLRPPYSARPP